MDQHPIRQHRLLLAHRTMAALFGAALVAFGLVGFAGGIPFFSTVGDMTMVGLATNGLLSTISIVVGIALTAAAVINGRVASTTMAWLGGAFLVSGLVNMAVLGTALNVLAFQFPNVAFSMVAGMVLLFSGLYGRISGGLADDNPYVLARRRRPVLDAEAMRSRLAELAPMSTAENAVSNGTGTAAQVAMVRASRLQRAVEHHRATNARATGPLATP